MFVWFLNLFRYYERKVRSCWETTDQRGKRNFHRYLFQSCYWKDTSPDTWKSYALVAILVVGVISCAPKRPIVGDVILVERVQFRRHCTYSSNVIAFLFECRKEK